MVEGEWMDLVEEQPMNSKFLYILMELCKTSLHHVLGEKKTTTGSDESHLMWVVTTTQGIARGLEYLHGQSQFKTQLGAVIEIRLSPWALRHSLRTNLAII